MAKTALHGVLQRVRMLAAMQTGRALSDADLLGRFIEQKDEAAFTVLVERHGPMVLGVCQRALRHSQDAEDACQATFLVFTRKAASIRKSAALGSWLHGVACRVCASLKREQTRRRYRERKASMPAASAGSVDNWHEVQAVLDEELQKLPNQYRAPLLLCYWEGKTRDEAAEALGHTTGKLHGLLERGRALLRERLSGRGLTLSAALCASFLASSAGKAALAPTLVVSCTRAALVLSAGEPLAAGMIPNQVLTLTKEVLQAMFVTKLKIAAAFIFCAGLLATLIGGTLTSKGLAQDATPKANTAEPKGSSKGESDEAFIRRMSKDLRGVDPSPAEVHFFVSNSDTGKRQKLIDLFIQERQAKQNKSKDTERQLAVDSLWINEGNFDFQAGRGAGQEFRLENPYKHPVNVVSLQSEFLRSIVAAARDKKDVAAVSQEYLDALTKYVKEQPKANDVPDALLQIEMVYRSLGKNVEAQAWGDKLTKEHPNSPARKNRQSALVSGGLSQLLMSLNSPGLDQKIQAKGETFLGKILAKHANDDDALKAVYLGTLGRQPTERELSFGKQVIARAGNRAAAFEEVLWALINSAEFHKRK